MQIVSMWAKNWIARTGAAAAAPVLAIQFQKLQNRRNLAQSPVSQEGERHFLT